MRRRIGADVLFASLGASSGRRWDRGRGRTGDGMNWDSGNHFRHSLSTAQPLHQGDFANPVSRTGAPFSVNSGFDNKTNPISGHNITLQ